jgi:hypothetical protein
MRSAIDEVFGICPYRSAKRDALRSIRPRINHGKCLMTLGMAVSFCDMPTDRHPGQAQREPGS